VIRRARQFSFQQTHLELIKRLKLSSQMAHEGVVRERRTGDTAAELAGGVATALGMDVRAQPLAERHELATTEHGMQVT
jgi:hypothetical protein